MEKTKSITIANTPSKFVQGAIGVLLSGAMTLVAHGTVLVYEGFSASADGAGDDYQFDATIRQKTDARLGFTGSWSNPGVAPGIDYDSRNDNMSYTNFTTGTNGVLEIYEARAGKNPAGRSINRSFSYTTPNTGDLYYVFSWSTADAAAVSFTLVGTGSGSGSRSQVINVSTTGVVTSVLAGVSAQNFNSGSETAHTDGTWNLLVVQVSDVAGSIYDDVAFYLNPTLAGNGTLGTADFTGKGIFTELNLVDGTRKSFDSMTFGATVGTGDEVRFDEFHITTDPSDFLTSEPGSGQFVISAVGSPQTVGTAITGITITAQDGSNATDTDFTGTVNFGGTGGFTGTSASFTAGVLSGVSVTPANAGSNLTFTVTDPVSGKTGSQTITTIQTQYEAWAGGADFDADTNGDGIKNGLAWLLGASDKNVSALGRLPTVTQSGGDLILNFNCLPVAARGGASLKVAHSTNLVSWTATANVVPDADNAVPDNNVTFVVGAGPAGPPALNSVTATIDSAAAAAGKLFGRLVATQP